MFPVKVVGLGNPIYGDDGVGSCLARFLSQNNDFVIDGNAHGIAILGNLMDAQNLVFIDVDADLKPGEVALERIEGELRIEDTAMLDAHRASPGLLVGYLRAMKAFNGDAYVIGIGPGNMEPFKPVSREVLNSIPKVIELLREVLGRYGVTLNVQGDPRDFVIKCYEDALGPVGNPTS
jgi:hydrogenase maturation protease